MATLTPVFSDRETAWHRTARFQFVPWVARLLGNGPLRGQSAPLPAGNPEGLTDETVEAIREMTNFAVWRFLARDCGWRERWAASGESGFSQRRLWKSGLAGKLPPLRFTADAVDLLIAVYNGTRSDASIEDLELPGCADANGDLFLQHLVFRRLTGSAQSLGVGAGFGWGRWIANPLNALFHVTSFVGAESSAPDWDRLAEPDVAPFFPWVGARIAADWRSRHDEIWRSRESAAAWYGGLAAMMNELMESMSGRPDLLIFLFDALTNETGFAAEDRERFEAATESLMRQKREKSAIPWADFLNVAECLRSIHRACVELHPVERSGPEKCFLAAWEEMTFSKVSDTLKDLRQQIRPSIS